MNITEQEIVRQLKLGDEKAYQYLFKAHYTILCHVAYAMLQDRFLAESVVGDVIFHLWEKRESINIETSIRNYLIRAVRNRCINYKQKDYVIKEVSLDQENNQDITDTALQRSVDHPLDHILEKELQQEINRSIARLPSECRTVFEMSRFENLNYQEIASKLNISINTVKYHIKKALARLASDLRKPGL